METLKLSSIILIVLFTTQLKAQDATYQKQSEAFRTSYTAENNKEYNKGIEALKLVYSEDSYEINLRLGWLSYLAGQQLASTEYYQKAIALKPFAIEPKLGLTYPVYAMGNTQKLIDLYNEVIHIAPCNTVALYQLGLIYFYQKQYEKAEKLFSKIVDLYPFDYDGLIMLAHTSFHLKKFREAKVLYHKVLLYNPSDNAALESLKLL